MSRSMDIITGLLGGGRKPQTRAVFVAGKVQPVTLPRMVWTILEEIAQWEGISLLDLIDHAATAQPDAPLADILDCFAIRYCRRKAVR